MKKFLLVGLCLIFSAVSAYAETRYITDVMEVTMRTGGGTDHKILSMVPSGTRLQLLESGGQWSRLRMDNGTEGWILNRFLTDTPPNAVELERLQRQYDQLRERYDNLKAGNDTDKEENRTLKQQASDLESRLTDVTQAHEQLKKESRDFFILKEKYEKATDELTRVSQLADELDKKLMSKNMYWFGLGALVLIIGFFMGTRSKKNRSYRL